MDSFTDAGGAGVDTSASTGAGSTVTEPAQPSIIEINDDNALIKYPGSEKPVKFADYRNGFQSQLTKANQERARMAQALRDRETALQRYRQQEADAKRSASQGQAQGVYDALKSLPYLTGEDAVRVVDDLTGQLRQRDQILLGTLKELQSMKQIVSSLNQNHTMSSFESKIGNWLTQGGYPVEAADLAKEIYLAYEGDDLDQEFPRIFADRWNQLKRIMTAQSQAAVRAARPNPFVPGRGGDAKPSKPLSLKADATPAEIADQLFPLMRETGT